MESYLLRYISTNIEFVGFIAASLGTISLIPQAIKVFLSRSTESISMIMYVIICIDSLLWMAYGVVLSLTPLIVQSSLTLACALSITLMKFLWK